jgi:hypothetical protein
VQYSSDGGICRILAHGASEKGSLVGPNDLAQLGAMQFMQVYDRNGLARLKGGSKFKHHIDWLPLVSLQLGTPRVGGAQPTELDIVILGNNSVAPVFWKECAGRGNDHWLKAIVDRFEDDGDQTWLFRLTIQEPLISGYGEGTTKDLRPQPIAMVKLSCTGVSIDYRHPDVRL